MASNPSNTSNTPSLVLIINRDATKECYDKIAISRTTDSFTITFVEKITNGKHAAKEVLDKQDRHDVLDYIEDVLDLLNMDNDANPHVSSDVLIPTHPIVSLNHKNYEARALMLRLVRSWCLRSSRS